MRRLLQRFLRRYAEAQAAAVAPHVVGRRVLDLGAGEAYVAAALRRRRGGFVCSVDLGPHARVPGPFVAADGARLPFPGGAFDTTLVLLTLHHCADAEAVLDEAGRVTRARLVVVESVYRNRLDRVWLDLLDGRVNRLRHGGRMPAASGFRTAAGWEALFAERGLPIIAARWTGSRRERLVHHPRLYVLDLAGRAATVAPPPEARRGAGRGSSPRG